jgi:hypothetical protein
VNLTDARRLFFELRAKNRIDVCEDHVIGDHPERGYSLDEVVRLVKTSGIFQDTTERTFLGERFYWRTKDIDGYDVRLVVEFENDETGQLILVISAGERT